MPKLNSNHMIFLKINTKLSQNGIVNYPKRYKKLKEVDYIINIVKGDVDEFIYF
jgi:hypothetical protein